MTGFVRTACSLKGVPTQRIVCSSQSHHCEINIADARSTQVNPEQIAFLLRSLNIPSSSEGRDEFSAGRGIGPMENNDVFCTQNARKTFLRPNIFTRFTVRRRFRLRLGNATIRYISIAINDIRTRFSGFVIGIQNKKSLIFFALRIFVCVLKWESDPQFLKNDVLVMFRNMSNS